MAVPSSATADSWLAPLPICQTVMRLCKRLTVDLQLWSGNLPTLSGFVPQRHAAERVQLMSQGKARHNTQLYEAVLIGRHKIEP